MSLRVADYGIHNLPPGGGGGGWGGCGSVKQIFAGGRTLVYRSHDNVFTVHKPSLHRITAFVQAFFFYLLGVGKLHLTVSRRFSGALFPLDALLITSHAAVVNQYHKPLCASWLSAVGGFWLQAIHLRAEIRGSRNEPRHGLKGAWCNKVVPIKLTQRERPANCTYSPLLQPMDSVDLSFAHVMGS